MNKTFASLIVASALCVTSAANAFEFVGGTIALDYSGLTDSDLNDINKTTLSGNVQVGFAREFSVQAGLSHSRMGLTNLDSTSIDVHGIFHLSENSSIGLFLGRDHFEGEGANFVGFEAGHKMGAFGGEVYVARAKEDDISGNFLGIRGAYDVWEYGSIGARYDRVDVEGLDVSRLSLVGEFAPTPGFSVNAEIGSADFDFAGKEMFFGIGMEFSFGPNSGTTFRKRSMLDVLPGL